MRILLLLLLFSGKAWANAGIEFISNDLTTARVQAQREGKLTVVKFYAEWCPPCKVMDEYVWTDDRVIGYVAQNCVAAKIDIDNFDGITYKQHFDINRLPTTLLLDACGKEVARFENYVSAGRLISWMQTFDRPAHRACDDGNAQALPEAFLANQNLLASRSEVAAPPAPVMPIAENLKIEVVKKTAETADEKFSANAAVANADLTRGFAVAAPPDSSGQNFIENLGKPTVHAVAPGQVPEKKSKWRIFQNKKKNEQPPAAEKPQEYSMISQPATKPVSFAEDNDHPEESRPAEMVDFPKPPPPPALAASAAVEPSSALLRWEMKRPAGFAVQVFASSTLLGAEEMKTACLSQFDQPVAVVAPREGSNLYRVMVGIFPSRADADAFKKVVKSSHRDAFVRDLSKI